MKRLFKLLALAIFVVVAASCAKEIQSDSVSDLFRRYDLSFSEPTKTELSGTGSKRSVSWNEGDGIKYYTQPNQSNAAAASVSLSGDKAYVTIPRGRSDEFINAVYGAAQLKSSTSIADCMYVSSPVKSNQSYTSFAEAHVCAAFSDDIENPNLQFHNAAAVLKFTSAASVHKVVFSGNNGEIVSAGTNGDLKISYADGRLSVASASTGGTSVTVATNGVESDFYIAVLPVSYPAGISVDCYDENDELIFTKKTGRAINMVSVHGGLKILNLGNMQEWTPVSLPVEVDLGLSVKWARYNVGATRPEEYGDYFAWGETSPKSEYKWGNYSYGTAKNGPFSEYVLDANYGTVDHKTVLDLEDDAAHAAWGNDWRMPSKEEWEELKSNCTWTWTTMNGVPGYKVTSRKSGYTANFIFLPANGMLSGSSVSDVGTVGNYWTSSISADYPYYAISPYLDSSSKSSGNCYRYFGLGVRPVQGEVVPVSTIDVSPTLEIVVGKTAALWASVQPANATYKNVTWSSSDESIATVSVNGKVTAVSVGMVTITAYSADATKTTGCEVKVKETATIPNGHDYVDLGLPSGLKWATMNVGAIKPEEYGNYFAWGEIEPQEYYLPTSYKWYKWYNNGEGYKVTKSCIDMSLWAFADSTGSPDFKDVLDLEDDAARVNWGGSWRMPTDAEWTELRENCTWTWTTLNGVNGRLVASKTNSNSIFLPAAGYRYGTSLIAVGSWGYYWSSSLHNSDSAYNFYFDSGNVNRNRDRGRYYGYSVRPVTE